MYRPWLLRHSIAIMRPGAVQGEEQLGEGAERAGAPGFQLCVQKGRGAADLAGVEALEPEFGHDLQGVPCRHALPANLGMYIWAMASITAREERRPRSSA